MDTALLLLVGSFVGAVAALVYFLAKRSVLRSVADMLPAYAEQLKTEAVEHVTGEVAKAVPQLEQLQRDLQTTWGKATRTIRTAKKVLDQPADDDDLLHAMNHPFAQGMIQALGLDPEKLAAGDPEEFQKAQDAIKGAAGGEGAKEPDLL